MLDAMDSPKPRSISHKNKLRWSMAGGLEARFAHSSSAPNSTELADVAAAEISVAVRRHVFVPRLSSSPRPPHETDEYNGNQQLKRDNNLT